LSKPAADRATVRADDRAAPRAKPGGKPGMRGRFLTLEGIDGCGKTTQARLLAGRLRAAGLPVLETREPGGTEIGRQLRAVLLRADNAALAPLTELLLFLADRVQHLREVIRPALARGEVVVCDRFHDATVAYQGHARGLDLAPLEPFLRAEVLTPRPDVTFWLDLPVALARERIAARGGAQGAAGSAADESRLDASAAAFHEKVRAGYAAIQAAEPGRVLRVDAAPAPEALHARIWALLGERYDVL
jgi:dTMP kinase